jgi:ribosomal RNA-processing protein 36
MSSKRPVSQFRNIYQVKKKECIDPRFNSAFGEYDPDYFRKQYNFINDLRKNEKETLTQQLKQDFNEEEGEESDKNEDNKYEKIKKKKEIKEAIGRLKQQISSFDQNEQKLELQKKLKAETRKDAADGKRPHYFNKTETRVLQLAQKYKELKQNGTVDKFLAKKRKKQMGKDNKRMKNDF